MDVTFLAIFKTKLMQVPIGKFYKYNSLMFTALKACSAVIYFYIFSRFSDAIY